MDILGFLKKNRALIGTCGGVLGTFATGVLAARAALRAEKELVGSESTEASEKLKIVLKHAGIPLLAGALTTGCILDAHNTHVKFENGLISSGVALCGLLSQAQHEKRLSLPSEMVVENASDDSRYGLFREINTGMIFSARIDDVLAACRDVNRAIYIGGGATIGEFFEFLNIDYISMSTDSKKAGSDWGWTPAYCEEYYIMPWVEFDFKRIELPDGRSVIDICPSVAPIPPDMLDAYDLFGGA